MGVDAESIVVEEAMRINKVSLSPVINASGVVLHTGLGRARMPSAAAHQVFAAANNHASVEIDLETGKRGDRQEHVRTLLTDLTGAEDAFVVNNCAAALFLTLTTLASGQEVILSRGQMVEIGGSFRMPDIVRSSGCTLVEVGCTNKTRIRDYQEVLSSQTGAILRCHPSNFKIIGFTDEPTVAELASLGTLLIDDLGSGCIVDTSRYGMSRQPTIQDSLRAGSHIVLSSGDKMLGGPQAGLILGKRDLLKPIRKHPLARAFRVDGLTLSALEATLKLYASGEEAEIPTLRYLARSLADVRRYALRLQKAYPGEAILAPGLTEIGGGSAPGVGIPTWRVGLASSDPDALAAKLRSSDPPVVGRIEEDLVWLDPRTVETDEVKLLCKILETL